MHKTHITIIQIISINNILKFSGIETFFEIYVHRRFGQKEYNQCKIRFPCCYVIWRKYSLLHFYVMEHFTIQLPREAALGGPVKYRWMYFCDMSLLKQNGQKSKQSRGINHRSKLKWRNVKFLVLLLSTSNKKKKLEDLSVTTMEGKNQLILLMTSRILLRK